MNVSFIVTIDTEAIDSNALMSTAEDIHSALDDHFDVISVKPWARPKEGLTNAPTINQFPTPGVN